MKKNDLILVIDMQNVYRSGQPWACRSTDEAARRILQILQRCPKADPQGPLLWGRGPSVVFTRFVPPADAQGTWKLYNQVNARINADPFLSEIVPQLQEATRSHPVLDKSTYSSLTLPRLRSAAQDAGRLILTGVVAECCVLATALDAIDLGVPLIWLDDAITGLSGQTEAAARLVIEGLAPAQATVMQVSDYLLEE